MRALFRFLLSAYPPAFRSRFGNEIVQQAEADCRRAWRRSTWAGWYCVLATGLDLVQAGLAERLAPVWARHVDGESELETGGMMMMGRWMRDLRLAIRTLRRSPGFALAAAGTLSLALGANAGIFSVADAVLLRPLPYADADRLVHVVASAPGSDLPDEFGVSMEFFLHYRDQATQLEDLATYNWFTATARAEDRVERLAQSMPSISLFSTLGVEPTLGRLPVEGEGGQVVLISHGLWTTWFGQDPSVIGRSYDFVNGLKEVIGVMPGDFRFPTAGVMAWIPIEHRPDDVVPGRFGGLALVGRMTPEADHASLGRELQTLALRLPGLYGGSPSYQSIIEQHVPVVRSLKEQLLGPVSTAIWILMGAVGVVLLIACANVAGLFTVRAESRGRDLALRRAIGAGRGALIRSQLSEAVVIAAVAGVGAVLLAWIGLPGFVRAAPDGLPRAADIGLSGQTVLFTALASGFTAIVCGLVPAIRSSVPSLDRLRDGTRGTTRRRSWTRNALVVAQTGLALVLLVGSGLLLRSSQQLRSVDLGYDTEDILTFQFAPDEAHLTDGPSWAAFHVDFMNRLRALPGVERVGIVENVPLDEGVRTVGFLTEGSTDADAESGTRGSVTFAAGDYFSAMGISVLQGRAFTDDDAAIPGNVIVSRAAVELLWPGEDPLGRRLSNTVIRDWHTVVGVVEDILQNDLRGEPEPIVYYPLVGPTPTSWAMTSPGYVVRTARAETIAPEIRALVREVAPSAPMYRVYTMASLVDRSMVQLSFTTLTMSITAILALTLGAIGLYGVLAYLVAQRTQEIGVRMALGAEAGRVRRMVVGQGIRVIALGIALGLGLSLLATRALSTLLFEVGAFDPATFVVTASAMAIVGFLASYIPARRASRVDPVESMRGG